MQGYFQIWAITLFLKENNLYLTKTHNATYCTTLFWQTKVIFSNIVFCTWLFAQITPKCMVLASCLEIKMYHATLKLVFCWSVCEMICSGWVYGAWWKTSPSYWYPPPWCSGWKGEFILLETVGDLPVSCLNCVSTYFLFQCRTFAKALHYKEMEFDGARTNRMDANPIAVVEALIHINNQLHQHEVIIYFLVCVQILFMLLS